MEEQEPLAEIIFWAIVSGFVGLIATMFTVALPILTLAPGHTAPDWLMRVACIPGWAIWSVYFWNTFRS